MGVRWDVEHQLLGHTHEAFGSGRNRQLPCISRNWLAFLWIGAVVLLASGCGGHSGQADTMTDAELVAKGKYSASIRLATNLSGPIRCECTRSFARPSIP